MAASGSGLHRGARRRPAGWLLLTCALALSATAAGCAGSDPDSATPPSSPASSGSSGSEVSPTASTGALDDSSHQNNLYLETPTANVEVTFAWDQGSYAITSGQESTWGGVTGCTSGKPQAQICQVVVTAGRKASSSVAQWFSAAAPVATASTGWSESTAPGELNFAITGTLTINGTSYPVAIGQGSFVMSGTDHNNWWLGGQGWIDLGGALLTPDKQNYVASSTNDAVLVVGTGLPPDAPGSSAS